MEEIKVVSLGQMMDLYGYFVTSDGRVLDYNKEPMKIYPSGIVRLHNALNRKLDVSAHRLIAAAFVPNPQGYNRVGFKDGNKNNRSADNLEWIKSTVKRTYKGRTELQQEIIRQKQQGCLDSTIARKLGTSIQYVKKTWSNRFDH